MRKGESSQVANLIREGQLDFLYELYQRGIPLNEDDISLLMRHNYISPEIPVKQKTKEGIDRKPDALDSKSYVQLKADQYVDVMNSEDIPDEYKGNKRHVILKNETYDKIAETSLFTYQGGANITKEDWLPKDKIYHEKDFVNWINSFNSGFQNMIRYKKFAMYCQQAKDWLNDPVQISQIEDPNEFKEYCFNEIQRCQENTLYFMEKYIVYNDIDGTGGIEPYVAAPVHKVLCYMVDCGYSIMAGKPRQIAATTTIGAIAVAKLIFNKNFFIKMIAQDKDKVEEIFDDKIKFPFNELPYWMKPTVSNDRDNFIRLSKKEQKGSRSGVNSKLQVVAPSVSAINGGAPAMALIDEAGYISILGKMIKEARPTLFKKDKTTGKLTMRRQIIIWGTGGEMDKGGKAYETEFYNTLKDWNNGNFEHGIVPLFFDWTTRPGITREFYESEKKVYTVEGPDKEEKAVQFRQTYPSIIEDMFLTSHKLLVGIDWINAQKERIKNVEHKARPTKGYFRPIYDESVRMDENSDTPFKIIGAEFVPLDDLHDDMGMASVEIFIHPQKGWRNRYYQGTDPISTDNGYSNMASAIFDSRINAPVAILNYRNPNHKYTFLQTMLLGIYYDVENTIKQGVPELLEGNIGTAYVDYKESKGYGRSLVQRSELEEHLQGGNSLIGIDNRGNRTQFIINRMYEVLTAYGEKIYFDTVFNQLRTFVSKVTPSGNQTWEVSDKKNFHDDVLFALVFAYICANTYSFREPKDVRKEMTSPRVKRKTVRDKDGFLKVIEYVERSHA